MTDNDIVKALDNEIFRNQNNTGNFRAYCDGVPKWILIESLDLINRQKAEIDFEPLDEISVEMILNLIEDVGTGRLLQVSATLPHGGTVTIKWDKADIKLIRKEQRKATA